MKRILSVLGLAVLLTVAPDPVAGQATSAEISVYNESGFEVTIYTSGRERGRLEPNYSKTYRVPLGECRVEARTDSKFDKEAYKDFVFTAYYPYDSWYIHNDDLN